MVQSPNLPAGYDEDYDEPEELQLDSLAAASAAAPSTILNNSDNGSRGPVSPRIQAEAEEEDGPDTEAVYAAGENGHRVADQQQQEQQEEVLSSEQRAGSDDAAAPVTHPLPARPVIEAPSSASSGAPPQTTNNLPPNPALAGASSLPPRPSSSSTAAPTPTLTPSGSRLPPGMTYNPALHPPKRELPVPDGLPGDRVADIDPEKYWTLRGHLNELCGIGGTSRWALTESLQGKTRGWERSLFADCLALLASQSGSREVNPSVSTSSHSSCSSRKSESTSFFSPPSAWVVTF